MQLLGRPAIGVLGFDKIDRFQVGPGDARNAPFVQDDSS